MEFRGTGISLANDDRIRIMYRALAIFILISYYGMAQPDSLIVNVRKTNTKYKSFLCDKNRIYAINERGNVVVWDLTTLDTLPFARHDTAAYKFLCVAKDRNNQIYFGTDKGDILIYRPETNALSHQRKLKYSANYLCFNSDNHPVAIIPYAVYDPIRRKRWTEFENHTTGIIYRKKILGLFFKKTDKYFQPPQYTFMDSKDRLWMTAGFGEFGGDVQIFDARNFKILDNKFDSIDPGLIFPRSVFEGPNGDIFITSGLQHFSNSGDIYRIDSSGTANKIFTSDGPRRVERKTGKVIDEGGLFIGPGAYNRQDNCMYFATTRGIYKMSLTNNKPGEPELVINPSLSWGAEPLAVGVAMSIKKMEFLDNGTLLFLTTMNGIGIYEAGKITFLH
ncbi:hypothetical protein [Chryseolinea soli]|nr:hypothetical protein [Chryseolinea soli]